MQPLPCGHRDDTDATVTKPGDARGTKKSATEKIDLAFVEFDNILNNRMDTLIPKFAASSPDFVRDYNNGRIIVDNTGGGSGPTPPAPPTPPTP